MQEAEFRKLTEGLFKGERLSLSKAITLAETSNPVLFQFRDRLLSLAEQANPGNSFRLSVTGIPGAGKSTLINLLGQHWIGCGHKVAVLAVDPSSEVSLGAVLGDKTRMTELAREENAFIRPSPTRLHLGGVASTTFETILLCEAAGYDRILVETVGVGQSELEVSQITDACLLLLIAGAGDELQAVKRGILEAADFILVNKAEGENKEKAGSFARELRQVSNLWQMKVPGQGTEILCGSGMDREFILQLVDCLERFFQRHSASGFLIQNRQRQLMRRIDLVLKTRLQEKITGSEVWLQLVSQVLQEIQSGRLRFFEAVNTYSSAIQIDLHKTT